MRYSNQKGSVCYDSSNYCTSPPTKNQDIEAEESKVEEEISFMNELKYHLKKNYSIFYAVVSVLSALVIAVVCIEDGYTPSNY
uniref:Neur_chan_memb domain-containing protein n=1 Tax=Rhabditophanes sp. KR3021 TaxID=114890 RepID=A0AC35TIA5_9BILA